MSRGEKSGPRRDRLDGLLQLGHRGAQVRADLDHPDEQPGELLALRAQGHANAYLSRPLRDGVGDHAVDSDGSQQQGHGAVLDVPDSDHTLDGRKPGDSIEVEGIVSAWAGMVTIIPVKVQLLGTEPAPRLEDLQLSDLNSFQHLGKLVRTSGVIIEIGDTTSGAYVLLKVKPDNYKLFFPHDSGAPAAVLSGFTRSSPGSPDRGRG